MNEMAGTTSEAAGSSRGVKARYIMIGGFLGAGKTTAIAQLAQTLKERGSKLGLITNDQGSRLVDTVLLRSRGFTTEEIAGGCFCCRFHSLMEAARRLTAATAPEVFIAEPVGSCTDLVATVSYPLRRIYGDQFEMAPLSVLVDPERAMRILGLRGRGRPFSEKVAYIYQKQLEEADLIVVNKLDTLRKADQARLEPALTRRFPDATVLWISAREGTGLAAWFEKLTARAPSTREAIEMDYDLYAGGEALLGWLNATVRFSAAEPLDGNQMVQFVAGQLRERFVREETEIAHLKMTLSPDSAFHDIAVINLVRNDYVPELSQSLPEAIRGGELVINLRAEGEPELLAAAVKEAIESCVAEHGGLEMRFDHLERFKPSRPVPTHRMAPAGGPVAFSQEKDRPA